MFKDHRYRFGVHGKFLAWGFTPRRREKRVFPVFSNGMTIDDYRDIYYAINRLCFVRN